MTTTQLAPSVPFPLSDLNGLSFARRKMVHLYTVQTFGRSLTAYGKNSSTHLRVLSKMLEALKYSEFESYTTYIDSGPLVIEV